MMMMMMMTVVLKVTSAAFAFPSGKEANPEPCTCCVLGLKIPSFRPELLLISPLWQHFPQWNKPRMQQVLPHVSFFSDPRAQISLDVPPLLFAGAGRHSWQEQVDFWTFWSRTWSGGSTPDKDLHYSTFCPVSSSLLSGCTGSCNEVQHEWLQWIWVPGGRKKNLKALSAL